MHRVVLDTSVIVTALRSRTGAGNAVLRAVAHGKVKPLVTVALFLEYEEVLKRADQRLAHGLALPAVDRFLSALASACEPVEVNFQWRPLLLDPDDEMLVEIAVNARASAIVTHNRKDFAMIPPRFGVNVITPGELLREINHV